MKQVVAIVSKGADKPIYTTPRRPEGHGKIEALNRLILASFVEEVKASSLSTVDELNVAFRGWVDRYQRTVHSETGEAPLARSAAPRFGEHRGRHGGGDLEREEAGVQRPHPSVVAISSDQRTRVIGDAVHSGALACQLTAQHRSSAGEPIGDLIRSEGTVLALPLSDTLAAGIDPQAMGGGLRDPRAHGGAFRGGGLVDGVGEVGGE